MHHKSACKAQIVFRSIITYILFSFFSAQVHAQSTITFTQNKTTLSTYEIVELTVTLPRSYSNPYNPDEIDVYALITPPGSTTPLKVVGFWHEVVTYNPAVSDRYMITQGSGKFKVRYAPTTTGTYTFRI